MPKKLKGPTKNELKRLGRAILEGMVYQAVLDGRLDPTGKPDSEFRQEVLRLIEATHDPNHKYLIKIDYRPSLLRHARLNLRQENEHLAVLFYATWAEHWFNDILVIVMRRRGLTKKEINEVLRAASFRSKISWLPRLLGLRRIHKPHLDRLSRISEKRNWFAHYKWNEQDLDEGDFLSSGEDLSNFEKTVKYLNRYHDEVVAQGARRTAKNTSRKLRP